MAPEEVVLDSARRRKIPERSITGARDRLEAHYLLKYKVWGKSPLSEIGEIRSVCNLARDQSSGN